MDVNWILLFFLWSVYLRTKSKYFRISNWKDLCHLIRHSRSREGENACLRSFAYKQNRNLSWRFDAIHIVGFFFLYRLSFLENSSAFRLTASLNFHQHFVSFVFNVATENQNVSFPLRRTEQSASTNGRLMSFCHLAKILFSKWSGNKSLFLLFWFSISNLLEKFIFPKTRGRKILDFFACCFDDAIKSFHSQRSCCFD